MHLSPASNVQMQSTSNHTTATSLPTGVNISSVTLAKNPNVRLHNLVSLANVQPGTQCIALPISLMMSSVSSNASSSSVGSSQPITVSSTTMTSYNISNSATIGSQNNGPVMLNSLDSNKRDGTSTNLITGTISSLGGRGRGGGNGGVSISASPSNHHQPHHHHHPQQQQPTSTVLLIDNSNGNDVQSLLQSSTGQHLTAMSSTTTGGIVAAKRNGPNMLSGLPISVAGTLNVHNLNTTCGQSISLLPAQSSSSSSHAAIAVSASSSSGVGQSSSVSVGHQLVGTFHSASTSSSSSIIPEYAKGLIAKPTSKFSGTSQLQVQLGGKSITAEPNATTIQLGNVGNTSKMRVHFQKPLHLQPHLLLQPAAANSAVSTPQLVSRKVNPKQIQSDY